MNRLKLCLLCFSFCISIIAGCGEKKEKALFFDQDCLPIINKFFAQIKTGNSETSLDWLLSLNPNIHQLDSSAIFMKQAFKLMNTTAGRFIEYKVLRKKEISNDIAIYSCLAKYEKKFYRLIFIFYRTDAVRIYRFMFDDDITTELEGSLKFYIES